MKKLKKSAYSVAAIATFALSMQAPAEAGGNRGYVEFAARHALGSQNGSRQNRELLILQSREQAGVQRDERRMLRLENRLGVNTAGTLSTVQAQRAAAHAIRLNSINLNGLPSELNLRSRRESYVLPTLSADVTINRGGEDVVVDSNTRLTAAEIAAVYQILSDGQ